MLYLGNVLREALVNYLFHQDKICYVIEFTHEIVSKDKFYQEADKLANSRDPIEPIR